MISRLKNTGGPTGRAGVIALVVLAAESMASAQELDDRTRIKIEELRTQRDARMGEVKEIYLRELGKLETAYRAEGNDEALARVREKITEARGGPDFRTLCKIRLDEEPAGPVRKLKAGTGRFKGSWEGAKISRVAEELENADFLPSERGAATALQSVALSDGYLYLIGKDVRIEVNGEAEESDQVYRKIEGNGLNREMVVRVALHSGDKFMISGPEAGVVAAEITTK